MYGKSLKTGKSITLTEEQRRMPPPEPRMIVSEVDGREGRLLQPKFQRRRHRCVVAMLLDDDLMVANGVGHGATEQEAFERARRRCVESYARGLPPKAVRSFKETPEQRERRLMTKKQKKALKAELAENPFAGWIT